MKSDDTLLELEAMTLFMEETNVWDAWVENKESYIKALSKRKEKPTDKIQLASVKLFAKEIGYPFDKETSKFLYTKDCEKKERKIINFNTMVLWHNKPYFFKDVIMDHMHKDTDFIAIVSKKLVKVCKMQFSKKIGIFTQSNVISFA